MNKWVPGYGDHFRDQFIKGLRIVIDHSQNATPESVAVYLHGQLMMNEFGDWYTSNLNVIREKKPPDAR
jgi:hypothetical protein